MNWHLFLDVVAWMWGILLTMMVIGGIIDYIDGGFDSYNETTFWGIVFIATLCWAWIIAG